MYKGTFGVVVYYYNMTFPVEVEVEYDEVEAASIKQALEEHNSSEDWPDLYDLEPSLAMKLRAAFIEQCPEDMQMEPEMLEFDYLSLPKVK